MLKTTLDACLNPNANTNETFSLQKGMQTLNAFIDELGNDLYDRIINKYQLNHLKDLAKGRLERGGLSVADVRAIMVGVAANVTAQDLANNPKLDNFIKLYSEQTRNIAQAQRQELAASMDKVALRQKHPFVGFCLKIGKAISDAAVKKNDLKDAFAGVQIHKAFEEDIKTVATLDYAKTYRADYSEEGKAKGISDPNLQASIQDEATRQELSSGLYLATDLAYRNLNHGAVLPILDADGQERLYQVHNIANDKGLVCTALIPVNPEPDQPLDVKVLFRGTHSGASAIVDLETTGAGSKTMRDNRIKLLNEVNSIVGNLQEKHPGTPVSLSIHGHSLGGSFAERFTSEVHQAIFHQNNHGVDPVVIATAAENQDLFTDAPKQRQRMVDNLQSRIALNNKEMEGKNYSALASLSGITTTAANSARLTSKEARVGEGFIALNQELNQPPQKQKLNYFKAGGDWVSQAGNRSLGSGFSAKSDVDVALLRKRADYGGITAVHPILGHCDHPLMRYHDKSQRDVNFDYHTQKKEPELLKKGLTSGRVLPQAAQKLYFKMPTALAEPITWVKRQHAKLMGKDATQVKGMEIKTQAEKEQKKAEKAQRKKP